MDPPACLRSGTENLAENTLLPCNCLSPSMAALAHDVGHGGVCTHVCVMVDAGVMCDCFLFPPAVVLTVVRESNQTPQ